MNKRKLITYIIIALVVIVVVAGLGFVVWASATPDLEADAIAAMQTDEKVLIEQGDWIVFTPQSQEPKMGIIFYPGGRVSPGAYAVTARNLAEFGYFVVIPSMPLNLAVFAPDKATDILIAYPLITKWVIGGHSLGGVMAAQYLKNNPNRISGLMLWASTPAENNSLDIFPTPALSLYASEDALFTPEDAAASRSLLPADTQMIEIIGGNHAGFGYYGIQSGDGEAKISKAEQHSMILAHTLPFLLYLETGVRLR